MSEGAKRIYLIYDGRARLNPVDALVIDYLDATTYEGAVDEARKKWEGFDYVLASYRRKGHRLFDEIIHIEVYL